MINTQYKQIIIIRRQGCIINIKYIEDVLNDRGIRYFYASESLPYGEMPGEKDIPTLILSLGGDGTMLLSMVSALQYMDAHVVGINDGKVGFLTEDIDEKEINDILNGVYFEPVEKHILSVRGRNADDPLGIKAANEIVIGTSAYAPPMIFYAMVDDKEVFSYRGTGLMLSTPTGSTALSMSNGGPILSPGVDALVISPILPHGLALRPVVVPANANIAFAVRQPTYGTKNLSVVADGRDIKTFKLERRDNMILELSAKKRVKVLESVLEGNHKDFFKLLTHKMGWGSGPKL